MRMTSPGTVWSLRYLAMSENSGINSERGVVAAILAPVKSPGSVSREAKILEMITCCASLKAAG